MPKLEDPYTFSLRIPEELALQLKEMAKQEKRSLNTLTTILIEEALLQRKARRQLAFETRVLET